MKRAPRSLQHHVLYRKYNGQDSEISALLGKCGLKEKSEFFEMDIGGFRRNQLDRLEVIRRHARNFTACLTWEGE
jgi:hypothetical protein